MFLNCTDDFVEAMVDGVKDEALRHALSFGIGLHQYVHRCITSIDFTNERSLASAALVWHQETERL